jgi:oligogalacturonide lyase
MPHKWRAMGMADCTRPVADEAVGRGPGGPFHKRNVSDRHECYDRNMQKWNRRWFLATLAATCAAETNGKGRTFPSVAVRYADPATEFTVLRLTDPQFTSSLPLAGNRGVSAHAVLYASDMAGSWQAFRMELRSKESRQLTDATRLDAASLALLPKDKGFWHFDGPALVETAFTNLKARDLYHVPDGFEKLPGASYSEDGQYAAFVEKSGARYRLQLLHLQKGTAATLVESSEELRDPLLRPRHAALVYRNAGQPSMINFDGTQSRRLPLAEGETLHLRWAADGQELQYLNRPPDPRQLTTLRKWTPDQPSDARIASTSQFVRFDANADSSVFVGASGSKASPYLLLLIRAAKRELTLAEHRSSDPALVNPIFSPNSQFVVFISDRHGKPAIYWIAVDKLVAETDGS